MSWDVDGNGNIDALTDGILYLRYLFGFADEALIKDSLADDATRTTAAEVLAYLESIRDQLDVDGNGQIDALTDGILNLRYLFGFAGEALTRDAVGDGATRDSAEQIVAYLESITDEEELPVDPETGVQYFPEELLVKLTGDVSANQAESLSESLGAISIERLGSSGLQGNSADGQWYVATFNSGTDLQEVRNTLAENPDVSDVELDYVLSIDFVPNDPDFNQLWGLNNTGQTGGNSDADIDAPEAWDIQRGSRDVVVAVVDTGVDYNHPDLTGNIWTNSGEIPNNGIDDDGNGFTDDFYGYDWVNEDGDPIDDNNHGTHVAGTIGAGGDNNLGVVGVSPNVSIMSLKFLAANGGGSTSNAAKAVIYATDMGADVINASFGGGGFSQVMVDALEYANDGGVLFVAAAGNDGNNNDISPQYPASYDVPNILSVAATDHNNQIASFSNYGERTVDLGAPGVNILSSIPGNQYASFNGTSMASPHVAGAAALLLAEDPSLTPTELKDILMTTADPVSSLQGQTVTGGRLNLNQAILAVADNQPPGNNPPIAADDSATIDGGTTGTIAVLANDSDPDGDAIEIDSFASTSAAGGTVTQSGNSLIYTPALGFPGTDSFSYTIADGNGGTDSATVTVTVEGTNPAPGAVDDLAFTQVNSSVTIGVLDNDFPDGDAISITGVSEPVAGGTISIDGNDLVYSPADDFVGVDSFTYTISDGNGGTDTAEVTVTVSDSVDPPNNDNFANAQEISGVPTTSTGQNVDATKEVGEPNHAGTGGASVWWSWTAPENGRVTITTAGSDFDTVLGVYTGNSLSSLTEIASDDDSGEGTTSSLTFSAVAGEDYKIAVDGFGGDAGNINLNIASAGASNNPPQADDDDFPFTLENSSVTIAVLDNDMDPDGDAISITGVSTPVVGTISIDGDALVYSPPDDFIGTDSFSYTITDAENTDTATVTVSVINSDNTQIITPVPSTQIVSAGDTVSIDVNYAANPPETPTSGTVFRLHWDSSQLEFDPATDLENIFSLGSQPTGGIEDDPITNGGFDGDPNTDKYFVQAWVDITGGSWPNDPTIPPTLYTANFTARPGFSGAAINFSTDIADLPAPNYQLEATSAKFLTSPDEDISSGTIVGNVTPNSDSILDVDDNGQVGALTDALLIIRYMFGFTGDALIDGLVAADANRRTPSAIEAYLEPYIPDFDDDQIRGRLDVDGNGLNDALTDGILILRYASGLTGNALTSGAVGTGATLTTAAEIENYLGSL